MVYSRISDWVTNLSFVFRLVRRVHINAIISDFRMKCMFELMSGEGSMSIVLSDWYPRFILNVCHMNSNYRKRWKKKSQIWYSLWWSVPEQSHPSSLFRFLEQQRKAFKFPRCKNPNEVITITHSNRTHAAHPLFLIQFQLLLSLCCHRALHCGHTHSSSRLLTIFPLFFCFF